MHERLIGSEANQVSMCAGKLQTICWQQNCHLQHVHCISTDHCQPGWHLLSAHQSLSGCKAAYQVPVGFLQVTVYCLTIWCCVRQVELRSRALLAMGAGDIVVPVFDDEPTSIIAYALSSRQASIPSLAAALQLPCRPLHSWPNLLHPCKAEKLLYL